MYIANSDKKKRKRRILPRQECENMISPSMALLDIRHQNQCLTQAVGAGVRVGAGASAGTYQPW